MPRSLINDVSISEMKSMREQGMSNQEIADALECSYITVLRHIGAEPPELTARRKSSGQQKRHSKESERKPNVVQTPEEEIPACLAVTSKVYELEGTVGKYTLKAGEDVVNITVKMDVEGEVITYTPPPFPLKLDAIDDFIKELQAIQRNAKKLNGGFEMW